MIGTRNGDTHGTKNITQPVHNEKVGELKFWILIENTAKFTHIMNIYGNGRGRWWWFKWWCSRPKRIDWSRFKASLAERWHFVRMRGRKLTGLDRIIKLIPEGMKGIWFVTLIWAEFNLFHNAAWIRKSLLPENRLNLFIFENLFNHNRLISGKSNAQFSTLIPESHIP